MGADVNQRVTHQNVSGCSNPMYSNNWTGVASVCSDSNILYISYFTFTFLFLHKRISHSRKGLRMTPLSWHVYGGNYDIVKLLISHGAEINADFDDSLESSLKITATDIASNLWRKDESDDFTRTLDLLISKGGKKYADMQL